MAFWRRPAAVARCTSGLLPMRVVWRTALTTVAGPKMLIVLMLQLPVVLMMQLPVVLMAVILHVRKCHLPAIDY